MAAFVCTLCIHTLAGDFPITAPARARSFLIPQGLIHPSVHIIAISPWHPPNSIVLVSLSAEGQVAHARRSGKGRERDIGCQSKFQHTLSVKVRLFHGKRWFHNGCIGFSGKGVHWLFREGRERPCIASALSPSLIASTISPFSCSEAWLLGRTF